jgi:hypothetical protein
MDFGLRLAGTCTIGFRCGCLYARGDQTGVPGWRLCADHVDERSAVADAFHTDDGECVVVCPSLPPVRRIASPRP